MSDDEIREEMDEIAADLEDNEYRLARDPRYVELKRELGRRGQWL